MGDDEWLWGFVHVHVHNACLCGSSVSTIYLCVEFL